MQEINASPVKGGRADNAVSDIPTFSREELLLGVVPCQWIYERATDDLKESQLLNIIAEQAKTMGLSVRTFKETYKKYVSVIRRKEQQQQRMETGGLSAFVGQPMAIDLGSYGSDGKTIFRLDESFRPVEVVNHPMLPTHYYRNIDTGEVSTEIWYNVGNYTQTIVIPNSTLANSQKITGLAQYGINANSTNAKDLVDFFVAMEVTNRELIPHSQCTNRLGWTKNNTFVPFCEDVFFDGNPKFAAAFQAIEYPHGSRDTWYSVAKKVRASNNVAAKIILVSAFAAPLVGRLGVQSGNVHIWGTSEIGKTVGLMLAASVAGDPSPEGKYVFNFNTTMVGMEQTLGFFRNILVPIDELQMRQGKDNHDNLLYMIAEGQGKTRGDKNGGLQLTSSWSTIAMTTGETPITMGNSGGGAINRAMQLACGDTPLFDNPREVAETVKENYGWGLRELVMLVRIQPDIIQRTKERLRDVQSTLMDMGATDKQATIGALHLAVDTLITENLFHDDNALKPEDIIGYLADKGTMDPNLRGYSYLQDWIVRNEPHFEDVPAPGIERYGKYTAGKTRLYVLKSVLDTELAKAGYNMEALAQWAINKGCMAGYTIKGRNKTCSTMPYRVGDSNQQQRCYAINIDVDISGCTIVAVEE